MNKNILIGLLIVISLTLGTIAIIQNQKTEKYKSTISECWTAVLNADENIGALDLQIMNAQSNSHTDYYSMRDAIRNFETKEQVQNPCFIK